jgi:hypothetical protein
MARAHKEIKVLETTETITLVSDQLILLVVIVTRDLKRIMKLIRTSFRDSISETLIWMEAQVIVISITNPRKD